MQERGEGREERHLVDGAHEGARLDRFLADRVEGRSRAGIQRLIGGGCVLLNGRVVKPHQKVRSGDVVRVSYPPPRESAVLPEEITLDILYEDDDLIVVNKPAGMIVHPAGSIATGTLVNALLARRAPLSGIGGVLKPGIVHRLDKGTSGCIVVAANDEAHRVLAAQFARREVEKEYLAIVRGVVPRERAQVEGLIARHPVDRKRMAVRRDRGRHAVTLYEVRERLGDCTSVSVRIRTGRTHQIRVHMAHLGHPVLGDPVYGGRTARREGIAVGRPMLHAWRLSFRHPRTGKTVRAEAPVPEDMARALERLRKRAEVSGSA